MSFANFMNLTNIEMGLIVMEGTIILSLFIILLCVRRVGNRVKGLPRPSSESGKGWVREFGGLCQNLTTNLEEKREITLQLISQLDERIHTLRSLLKKMDEKSVSPKNGVDAEIARMAEAGLDITQIARKLGLSKGEVQLTLDLKRYGQ